MNLDNPEGESAAVDVDEKPRTLFVGNIPATVKKRDLELLFGDVGPIKRCHIQYPRKSANSSKDEPLVAYITYALTQDATAAVEKFASHKIENKKLNIKLVKSRVEQHREPRVYRTPVEGEGVAQVEANKEKAPRPKKNLKKARLIVRNISFQTNELNLKKHFESCGEVTEVNILRKRSGKLVGCAFIQYKNVHEGFKAMKELNAKEFLGRQIVIDWAVSKEKYQKGGDGGDASVKPELEDVEEIKEEIEDNKKNKKDKIKLEDEEDDTDAGDESDEEMDSDVQEIGVKPRVPVNSNDADEGKTLFIRNLSFDVTEEELQEFFQKFGPLKYALICKDSLTEHPKGTGFVKFQDLESATECLTKFEEDSSNFVLHDRFFFVIMAMSKGKLEAKMNSGKEKTSKDNRRLYLAREGFIRPGSDAAIGVSATDMDQRASIHKAKNQMLKDLNIFLSDTRLCVHNLPVTLKDENLRKIFLKHAGSNAKITEARIMRDLNTLNRDSKGYGFVTFTNHENALEALRNINNNPSIFTANKRPIVEFSLENRKALVAKEKRLEKSKSNLGKHSDEKHNEENSNEDSKLSKRQKRKLKKAESADDTTEINANGDNKQSKRQKRKLNKAESLDDVTEENVNDDTKQSKRQKRILNKTENSEDITEENNENVAEEEPAKKKKKLRHRKSEDDDGPAFVGLSGKKGVTKLPSLKSKGKITRKSLKRTQKKLPRRMREPKMVSKKNPDATDKLDNLVSKYKNQTLGVESSEKKRGKKWFD